MSNVKDKNEASQNQTDGKGICALDGAAWPNMATALRVLYCLIFNILELVCKFREYMGKGQTRKISDIRSIGERTVVCRQNSLQRKSSQEVMQEWLNREAPDETRVYAYSNFTDALESFIVSVAFASHGRHSAKVALNDTDKRKTTAKVLKSIESIQGRARKSVKFRFLFKPLLSFLDDIEKSRVASVTDFIEMLAIDMLQKPDTWYVCFVHGRLRAQNVPQNVYETTLATLALFFREGAGLESHILFGGWKSADRAVNAALTLIMYCAVMKCCPTACNEINVTEFTSIERLMIANTDQKFHRMVSLSITKSASLFKDKMMWDITLNCCNEYVESAWSDSSLERAAWTLQYGLKHIGKELYDKLEELNGKRKLDLTSMNALSLVSFSLAGMVRFEGLDDCIYRATEASDAKLHLQGNLPMPTVQDLIQLNVIRRIRESTYIVNELPGSDKKFKGLWIGTRLRLVASAKAESFTATLEQFVG